MAPGRRRRPRPRARRAAGMRAPTCCADARIVSKTRGVVAGARLGGGEREAGRLPGRSACLYLLLAQCPLFRWQARACRCAGPNHGCPDPGHRGRCRHPASSLQELMHRSFRMFLFLCFFKCLKCFRMGTGATPPRGAHRVRLRPGPAGPGPCDGGCGLSARGSAAPSRAGLGRSWRCRSKMGGRCSTCARAPGRNVRRTAQAAHAPHVEGRTDGCQPAWCS